MEHQALARELQVEETLAPRNGDMIRLAPGPAEVIDETPAGRLHLDGTRLIPADSEPLRDRRKIAVVGHVSITIALDDRGRVQAGPEARARGLAELDGRTAAESLAELEEAAEDAFERLDPRKKKDPDAVEEAIERAVRRAAERIWGKRPLVDAIVLTV
jgi:ribonuclease J